jgi:hypothetical protein
VKKRLRRRPCHCLCPQVHPEVRGICQAESAVTVRRFKTQVAGEAEFAMCQPCAGARDTAVAAGHDPVLMLPVVRRRGPLDKSGDALTIKSGGRGIRTHGDVAATMVFKTIAIGH